MVTFRRLERLQWCCRSLVETSLRLQLTWKPHGQLPAHWVSWTSHTGGSMGPSRQESGSAASAREVHLCKALLLMVPCNCRCLARY